MANVLAGLREAVGAEHVLTGGDCAGYERDWRGREQGRALAVVRPKNTQEVAAVLRHCATHATPVVAQGGNTGLAMGSTPDTSGRAVVLSTTRMNRLRALDRANLTMTVDAGCVLQQAQHWAAEADLLLPLSLASEGSCTIGGNMATNAGGTQVLRYGNARDLCLGLEVVTVQGQVWHGLSGLRKDNTGYDLRHLMIGSEGTLGIITAATLKLYPMPAARLTAWARVPSVSAAVSLLGVAQRHLDAALTGFEMMGQQALAITARQLPSLHIPFEGAGPYAVLIEVSDAHGEDQARQALEAVLQEGFEAEHITDAVVAQSLQQAQALWHVRESIPLAQAQEGLNIKHDIALPVSRLAEFVQHTDAALLSAVPGARLVNFGHLGDGNLHYNVQAPEGVEAAAFLRTHEHAINTLVYESVATHGGSFSAEHGVGRQKADRLQQYKDATGLHIMHAIKGALDPLNLLNPGAILRAQAS
ncbi:MAG: hypothetical protein RL019_1781 [Pseudomonadota bacterium]